MFQTLGGWDATWLMSAEVFEDEHWDRIRYWTPLPHLVLGRLGWSDPALGVARWILMGQPDSTPELSLLADVWGADALMYFSHPQKDWAPHSQSELGFDLGESGKRISRIYESAPTAQAFSGCGELHIQEHLDWQLVHSGQPTARSEVFRNSTGTPESFVLRLQTMGGWYSRLQMKGDEISAGFPDKGLELTVIAPPVGQLGNFQRSPITGLWHSGPHEAHLLGNNVLNGPIREVTRPVECATLGSVEAKASFRHTNAAAFWIASEIARRHPHFALHGFGERGDLRLESEYAQAINISRHGTVRVGGLEIESGSELVMADDKRKLVEGLEEKLGLPRKKHAAATTERTVAYRAMAHILAVTICDKATWNFVPDDPGTRGGWYLTRESRPVAHFHADGTVSVGKIRVNLLERYQANLRKMASTIGEVLGPVLP